MRTPKIVELASQEQRELILSLLEELGYSLFEPYFLWRLKRASGFTRIRTWDEAETAIRILEGIKARRSGDSVIAEPDAGGKGHAA